MRLLSINLEGQYKGLKDQFFDFSNSTGNIVAFIGLNGSGKSQLMQLIAETFAYVERKQRNDFVVRRKLPFTVTIHYQMQVVKGENGIGFYQLTIKNNGAVECKSRVYEESEYNECSIESLPYPDFVVGYSSGLNENLQRSFMKNALQYFEVMQIRMRRQKEVNGVEGVGPLADINRKYLKKYPNIFKTNQAIVGYADYFYPENTLKESDTDCTRMVYLDYDSARLLVASLAALPINEVKDTLGELTFNKLTKIKLKYDFRNGVFEEDNIKDLQLIIRIAGNSNIEGISNKTKSEEFDRYELDYLSAYITLDLTDQRIAAELSESNDSVRLFLRLYKLQLLGIKNWQSSIRISLRKDDFFDTVKKPLKTKMPLSIVELKLCDEKGRVIDYDDLSDGEAQLLEILAVAKVFRENRTLFLFDEPETHLNPSWRTYFHQYLEKILGRPNQQQAFVSTHSPFMISSLRKENVYLFKRNSDGLVVMEPTNSQTYGASFDVLVKYFFGMHSLISQTAVAEVKNHLPQTRDPRALKEAQKWIEENLGESMEKAYLLRKLQS